MTRNKPPSFDFYPDDFVGGTMHLHPICIGIYVRLLCFQWSHGAIPDDSDQIQRITGASQKELKIFLEIVLKKFEKNSKGQWVNDRMERERIKKHKVSEKRAKAASSRWGADANASVLHGQLDANASANAPTDACANAMLPIRKLDVDAGCIAESADGFEDFWKEFPEKRGKKPAREAYKKALARLQKKVGIEVAQEKLKNAATDYANFLGSSPNPPKAKYAQGWLNDERYEDDFTIPSVRPINRDPRGNLALLGADFMETLAHG
jgi:uncharacterized protein YdaU (DUF1376 family)